MLLTTGFGPTVFAQQAKPAATARVYNSTLATLNVEFYRDRVENAEFIIRPGQTMRVIVPAGRVRLIAYTFHKPPKVYEDDVWFNRDANVDVKLSSSMFGSAELREAPELPDRARSRAKLPVSAEPAKICCNLVSTV